MTTQTSVIQQFLEFSAEVQEKNGGGRFISPARFLLDNGCEFTEFSEDNVLKGKAKECYSNAGRLALFKPEKYTFCEGYCLSMGIPIQHAWCVDKDNRIVDPTLQGLDYIGEYFGIKFSHRYFKSVLNKTGYWGILDPMINRNIYDTAFENPYWMFAQ